MLDILKVISYISLLHFGVTGQYLSMPEGSPCTWLGLNGTCVLIHRCYSAKMHIEEKRSPPVCDYQGKEPVICCTDCELVQDSRKIIFDEYLGFLYKIGKKAHDQCLENLHNVFYQCKAVSPKEIKWEPDFKGNCNRLNIQDQAVAFSGGGIGGRDAERNEYPHMALLGYGPEYSSAQWLCGGSVISHNFILTAGHCGSSTSLGPVTYAGLGILKRTDPPYLWKQYRIKRIIPHPEYKAPSKYNDITLLETGAPIIFSFELRPACLHYDDTVDDKADATGWGALGQRRELADTLQSIRLEKFTDAECAAQYPPHRYLINGYDSATQMCYGNHKEIKDTCVGDSGGPLQVQKNHHVSNCVYTILGVTSFGTPCDVTVGNSGIYTRVSYYVPWIESIVWPDNE